jgi:MFS superfamily sulfate permease-like transporter
VGAAGISLVSFCSMMTTARGFAAKNGYHIDVNRDMVALGVSDLASAVNRGFVVSGADSRTAVADSSGGKTQVASLFAALAMAIVLIFLTGPLAFLPRAALAAILISSAIGLFDIASMRDYYRISMAEFLQSLVAMVGVMTLGVLRGVLVAVGIAIFRLLQQASHPRDEVLGLVKGRAGDDYRSEAEGGELLPDIIVYRFESALVFFNADHFMGRVHSVIDNHPTTPKCFLLDAEAIPFIDVSGTYTLRALRRELEERGIVLIVARLTNNFHSILLRSGVLEEIGHNNVHHTIHSGVRKFRDNSEK